ncbi:hypothetical protein DAEQUDRAFT_725908 [Daedalea quercina L-15889]|uniref:Uncharacterized protein n=1 Tax=Daedalea quercina L-15889 TaxID=1314783 RepID=A0A165QU56_9APHY|nr:hypothetical protein DAEQUDRAFT_725908 [Daedalea quercina L-15889]
MPRARLWDPPLDSTALIIVGALTSSFFMRIFLWVYTIARHQDKFPCPWSDKDIPRYEGWRNFLLCQGRLCPCHDALQPDEHDDHHARRNTGYTLGRLTTLERTEVGIVYGTADLRHGRC